MEKGEKLKLARRYHTPSLSQDDLAGLLKVSRSKVARYETRHEIPSDILEKAAAILNVRTEWFYDDTDDLPTMHRRVPVEETQNIRAKHPDDMSRSERAMVGGIYVAIPVWRGVSAGSDQECAFMEASTPEFKEVPAFLTMGNPADHVLCIASGMSMSPRIGHSERAIVRLDPDVPVGHLVVARAPDNRNFIKSLRKQQGRLELHSIGEGFAPISDLDGWTIKGGVVAIIHDYEDGRPNIEWFDGRLLRG